MWVVAASLSLAVFATRWPFRSHALFSWDSANFALALLRIDIAAHRPHPPGYLGYVFAARALNRVFHDANTALVVWNILATAAAAIVLTTFAWESADRERRGWSALAAVSLLLSSPLLWFYGEIAEIYPSELLCALLIAYSGRRAVRGDDRAMYWCVAALAVAAVFKVVTAALMLPVAVYAWTHVSPTCRRRSAGLVTIVVCAVGVPVLLAQRNLISAVWGQAVSTTWFLRGDTLTPLRTLNRNIRDTLTAGVVALGVINVGALAIWAWADRRLPAGFNRLLAILWLVPYLFLLIFVHIAKPGYLLPILPLGALVAGAFYARQRPGVAAALIAAQALVNAGHFLLVTPPSEATTGGVARYREKSVFQQAASDLQALTFPTRFTIIQSDERMHELLNLVATTCADGEAIIVAGTEPVDWRRVMWYLPSATAIRITNGRFDYLGRHTESVPLPASGLVLRTRCPVIWLTPDEGPDALHQLDPLAVPVPHLGWMTAAGTLSVTPGSITLLAPDGAQAGR